MKNFTRYLLAILLFVFALNQSNAQPCVATLTANGPTQFCTGGSVTLTSYYDQSDYSYQWYHDGNIINGATSPNYVVTENGGYWCEIINFSCISVTPLSIYVSVIPVPTAVISITGATIICSGDSTRLNANTPGGITYQWQVNGTNITGAVSSFYYAKLAGNYTCLEANTCGTDTSNAITISVNQLPPANIYTSSITKFCLGNAVSTTINVNTAIGTVYQWRKNGSNISGATLSSYNASSIGNYTCRVTNCFGSSISNTIPITIDSTCTACFYFDGVDDRVTIPANTVYNMGAAFTIEAWIRDDASQNDASIETILSNSNTGTPNAINIFISNGRLCGGLGPDLRDGQCHRIAVTHDPASNNYFYYADGVQLYRNPSGANITSTLPLLIGARDNGGTAINFFKGIIKEIRIWNDAYHLSDMNNVLDGTSNPKLVGYWRLNEGTGQTVTDYSVTANNGSRGITTAIESPDPVWGNGCPACPLPAATITANGATTFCFGGSVTLNAQQTGTGYTYQWRVNGNTIIGATSSSYIAKATGNYDVLITNGCSSYSNAITVTVNGNLSNFILQPNGANGMDITTGSGALAGNDPDFKINAWTQYSGNATRGYLRFDLSTLPVNTVVHHAILTLYNSPTATLSGGITNPPGAHYHGYGISSNTSWLQKITSPWSETALGSPAISIVNQVTLPQDTNAHQDYLIDVSSMVQDMVTNPAANYGFRVRLKNESYYTALLFASSDYPDSTKWPKLSVFYYDNSVSITAAGGTSICTGNTVTLNATAIAGATYQWQRNGVAISGATAPSYSATTAGSYSCVVTGNCSNGTSNTIVVTILNTPATPGTVTGIAKPCPGDNGIAYSVTAVANATTYNWTMPAGASIATGAGTRNITVNFTTSFISGTMTVTASNACGTSGVRNKSVSRNIPATPSAITGQTYGLCGATGKIYSVTNVAGINYLWTVPVGATIVNGQGTNSVTVNFASTNFTGNVSVIANNSCMASAVRNLTVRAIPSTPLSITGPPTACANQQNVAYSAAAITGATSYTWGVPSGATIISGQGTTAIVMKYGTASGIVRVRAVNGCGNSGYRNLAVVINCREGLEDEIDWNALVYPNPSKDIFTIYVSNSNEVNYSLIVRDVIGRIIYQQENILTDEPFDFGTELSSGMYFAEINQGEERKIIRLIRSN